MPYAVEIGTVMLKSSTPITEEMKQEAVRLMLKNARLFSTPTGEVVAEWQSTER